MLGIARSQGGLAVYGKDRDMGEAISIEQRLHDLFTGLRQREPRPQPREESPREMEQRAMERLYGGPPSAVVRIERDAGSDTG
jgi:hypothetical protein